LRGRPHELEAGSVFCYGPGVACRIRTDPDLVLTKVFVDVAGADAEDLLDQAGLSPGEYQRVARIVELSEVFDGMCREGLRHGPDVHAIVATYFRLLLLKARAHRVRAQPGGTQRLETFLRCRQFLQDHYLRFTSIETAADELGLTPSYLCRLFREFGERSPYQFLLRARMNHALDSLMLSGGCVKRACYESGFRDPAHFSRLFKQIHGLSPRALVAGTLRLPGYSQRDPPEG
jgi:AraC-like DNA-binding protein